MVKISLEELKDMELFQELSDETLKLLSEHCDMKE